MRLYSALALMSSALALAACGGGSTTSGLALLASNGKVCGINDNTCQVKPTSTGTPSLPDSDGDGIPDRDDTNGNIGSGAGGNNTVTATGTKTIALNVEVLDKPTKGPTALSVLTSVTSPNHAATEAAILSSSKPKSIKVAIDTKSDANSTWPVAIEQTEFALGTRDLSWIYLGHVNTNSFAVTDRAGNPVVYSAGANVFFYTTTHTHNGRTYNSGDIVDTTEDFYWTQLIPYMGTKANGGAKGGYTEYHALDKSTNRDEALQVWAWSGDSYSTHFGIRSPGTWSKHAWSYGGKAATNMPTSGTARYNGRFVGTAKTSNWIKPDGALVDPNADWQIQGRSELTADFGTSEIRGTLSTESWTSKQAGLNNSYFTWLTQEAANTPNSATNLPGTPSVPTPSMPDYYEIYDAKVLLKGKIVAPTGVPATGATVLNNFEGTASLENPYLSSSNPMYGGFFGTNGTEATGIFTVSGQTIAPVGGSSGLNNKDGAFLDINGTFNAQCVVVAATGLCAP